MIKSVNILGATGSIGCSTLEIIRNNPDKFIVGSMVGGTNATRLAELAVEFRPKVVAIADEARYGELCALLSGSGVEVLAGEQDVLWAASVPSDVTVSAIVGFAALAPTIAAIANTKVLALANKESIVCAGEFILSKVKEHGVKLIPVDSEHNALFQVFERDNAHLVDRVTITASGGAFRDLSYEQMRNVTPDMALLHPNWNMGAKITVDCATLANKGLEFIEACTLFGIVPQRVSVLVHPQSIVHGMVHYSDGSVLTHMAMPDMKTPISYALSYPSRIGIPHTALDLGRVGGLQFYEPDYLRFPMLKLAQDSFVEGAAAVVAFNAANEVAVGAFLKSKIGFLDIHRVVSRCVEDNSRQHLGDLEAVNTWNRESRLRAAEAIGNL